MNYPINIEKAVREFERLHPASQNKSDIIREIYSEVNKAYKQGIKDGKAMANAERSGI